MKRTAKPVQQFMLPIALSFSIEPIKRSDLVTFVFRERHAPGDRDFKLRRRNATEVLQKMVPGVKFLKAGPLEIAFSIVATRTQANDMIISEMLRAMSAMANRRMRKLSLRRCRCSSPG
jgi:hypothetical protein